MHQYGFGELAAWLARMPQPAYEILVADIEGPEGLSSEPERHEPLSIRLDAHHHVVASFLRSMAEAYRSLHAGEAVEEGLRHRLDGIVSKLLPEDMDQAKREGALDRLSKVLERRRSVDLQLAREIAIRGAIPSARRFDSIVDLRAVYLDQPDTPAEFLPLVQFRVLSAASDPADRERVFQMDRVALKRLGDAVKAAEHRLDVAERDMARLAGKSRRDV